MTLWHLPLEHIYKQLQSSEKGLSSSEAKKRLKTYGLNTLTPPQKHKGIKLFFNQYKSPLVLLLIGAALLSVFLGQFLDASIIFSIVFLGGLLGFFQEKGALNALEKVMSFIKYETTVLRDGKKTIMSSEEIVPGDILHLCGGQRIPADCLVIEAKHFFLDESTLTGESLPVEKTSQPSPPNAPPAKRGNALFLGTNAVGGTASAIVIATGRQTEYSHIAEKVRFKPPETSFEKGVKHFGNFLLKVTLLLVIFIFLANAFFHKPLLDSFIFSVALAVGLTPQLLPAIISINLAHGANRMAALHVIVKRLPAIENFGQMDLLCMDKTGTITEGKIKLNDIVGMDGNEAQKPSLFAYLNAYYQEGYSNPMDKAILHFHKWDVHAWDKVDEIPYDFQRKRLSLILKNKNSELLVSKGAFSQIISICDRVELPNGSIEPLRKHKKEVTQYFERKSQDGFRVLGLAYGEGRQEKNLIFLGFIQFYDPIKPDIVDAIGALKEKGVQVKIITGDNLFVATAVAKHLGLPVDAVMTGDELRNTPAKKLHAALRSKSIFAEIEPAQKKKIITALRSSNHVVGFLGDGVNDVAAIHTADVGIAVDTGSEAAKEAADIVLLKKDLNVLRSGIEEGRQTFANTMKYVYMAISANFGNMFSMAGASLFLNYLPLLPKQVLLTNFLSDFPEMALATDHVDEEIVERPTRWNLSSIKRFMLLFGLLSTVADFLTFGVLLLFFQADAALFRSGWFVESVVSAALIVLVVRTRQFAFFSRPSQVLFLTVMAIVCFVLVLPFTPLARPLGFKPLPLLFFVALPGIIAFYIASVEIAKYFFFHKKSKIKSLFKMLKGKLK